MEKHRPSPIRPLKTALDEAFGQLTKYQNNEIKIVKTNRYWLDISLGGIIPGDIITVAGGSSMGKSHELLSLRNDIMSKEVNSGADNYIWLSNSYEMRVIAQLVRDLHKKLDKSKRDIYGNPFTQEERQLVKDYYKEFADGRFYINEDMLSAEEFEMFTDEFLAQHTDKEMVFVDIDHIALTIDQYSDTRIAVSNTTDALNRLKKKYKNVCFVILSQLNRDIFSRIKEKDITAMPNSSDLYFSSEIMNISDYVYVVHNPYKLGINAFSRVLTKTYEYLRPHFVEEKGSKVSFSTIGNIFYIVLKSRESEPVYRDIFIEELEMDITDWVQEDKDEINTELEF